MLSEYPHPGRFITLEGPDGGGKSTLAPLLVETLKNLGYCVLLTREPGHTRVGEAIRQIVLNPQYEGLTTDAEALLFGASRSQFVDETIVPALNNGKLVICDRYVDSSFAYQGHARGLGEDRIRQINAYAMSKAMPFLTLLLDVELETGLQRVMHKRKDKIDRLDAESLSFHSKVREAYLTMAKKEPDRFYAIDTTKMPPTQVFNQALDVVLNRLQASEYVLERKI